MAASDQTYRQTKVLHVVFAASSVFMLVTTFWMFWEDYNRPFKKEQKVFRTVEEELSKRTMLAAAPSADARAKVFEAEAEVAKAKATLAAAKGAANESVRARVTQKAKEETQLANRKADYDSLMSFYNIEVEHRSPETPTAKRYLSELDVIRKELDEKKKQIESLAFEIDEARLKPYDVKPDKYDAVSISPADAEAKLNAAEAHLKLLTEDFDRFAKLANQKEWGFGDWFRSLPIIDGFASPTRIQQYTLEELPIDYSFKYVTRYDRCTTCHLGMEKSSYTADAVRRLNDDPLSDPYLKGKLTDAIIALTDRDRANRGQERLNEKEIADLTRQIENGSYGSYGQYAPEAVKLTDSRIAQFTAHPRLDLFVDSNSPHSAEKFGCTSCHDGQGSATTFVDASHTPNDVLTEREWKKLHNWQSIHFWDYRMQPRRFAESTCLKCHHQVEDLTRGSQVEAPVLVKGYNLVRELGCFGCHEISGLKSGREIGPDLRLEPEPPLEALTPEERLKRLADPANPPGTQRKVGPSLLRIAEKTNEAWARAWIKSPREFRPDTRMPHYYLQVTNSPEALPDAQKRFPDTEITAIAHYLFTKSRELLGEAKKHANDDAATREADDAKVTELSARIASNETLEKDRKDAVRELVAVKSRIAARAQALPAADALKLPDRKAEGTVVDEGHFLFNTRGCMACHKHDAAAKAGTFADKPIPAMVSESNHGPNLSRLAAKLGTEAGKPETARAWLVSWLLNPNNHSPRTLMPSVQLSEDDADKIALWLISQKSDWKGPTVETPDRTALKALARVYLKNLTARELERIIEGEEGFSEAELAAKAIDADEHLLAGRLDDDKLKMFVGKKAIANLGCYACHNVPGFENPKPIGVALNDWGKKDPDRLAFEDAEHFIEEHFNIVDVRRNLTDAEKKSNEGRPAERQMTSWSMKGDKQPYERFFYEKVHHGHATREGFLHLKLQEPRSFDYNRIKDWTERTRMPQFKFARIQRNEGESDEAFSLRASNAEAEAREAVMTFVLGLVAEPVPAKFVNRPSGDKLAEIKGRKVLEKFNCAGCHTLQSETFQFSTTDLKFVKKEDGKPDEVTFFKAPEWLEKKYTDYKESADQYGLDHRYSEHNVWGGKIDGKGTVTAKLSAIEIVKDAEGFEGQNFISGNLTHALRFANAKGEVRDLPAYTFVQLPEAAMTAHSPAQGGVFANLLTKYLQERDKTYYDPNGGYAQSASPPSLVREGEKTQPGWLFRFLQQPHAIRPLTVLRMPKFNLSDEDTQSLVDYFAAVDKRENPGIGLTAPYPKVAQRDEGYRLARTREYVARLKADKVFDARVKELEPFWQSQFREELAQAEARVKAAQARVEQAKKDMKEDAAIADSLKAAEVALAKIKEGGESNFVAAAKKQWEEKEAYVLDAYRLVSDANLCVKCHQVGTMPVEQEQGPKLGLAAERLRPDWTERWIANPQRFLTFKTVMPINFPANAEKNPYPQFHASVKGFSKEQIQACRDFLMFYPDVADWPILKARTAAAGATGGK